jgi:hypothetical protein
MKYVKLVSIFLVALLALVILNAFVLYLVLPDPKTFVYTREWVIFVLLLGGVLYQFNEIVLVNLQKWVCKKS